MKIVQFASLIFFCSCLGAVIPTAILGKEAPPIASVSGLAIGFLGSTAYAKHKIDSE
jgi:hypothetical protein